MNPALSRLARLAGLQLQFVDTLDRTIVADEESVRAVLGSIGLTADSDADVRTSLQRLRDEKARVVEPVSVARTGSHPEIRTKLSGRDRLEVIVSDENGDEVESSWQTRAGAEGAVLTLTGQGTVAGYFDVVIRQGGEEATTRLLLAPSRAYSHGPERRWGVFSPAYALRSDDDRGVGSYDDLRWLAEWAREQGASCVGTLPLYATFLHSLHDPSPYAPVSRLFWNEEFVRSGGQQLPGGDELVFWKEAAEQHRLVTWEEAQAVFEDESPDRAALLAHEERQPLARLYGAFRARTDMEDRSWRQWEDASELAVLAWAETPIARWYRWAQWQAEEALQSLQSDTIGLYLDFPLGTNSDGFDVWRWRSLYVDGVSIGAPPDLAYRQGQDWGFRAPHPQRMREEGWRHWSGLIRRAMSYASMLRLDHVMGLHRMWWVPDGLGPSRGLYMHYAAEELYAILSIESHRARCEVAGEDLGTVPPVVTRTMKRWGINGLWALERQLTHARGGKVGTIGEDRVASIGTHDMPPLASFLEGSDLEEKARLGVLSPERARDEVRKRPGTIEILRRWLSSHGAEPLENPDQLLAGILDVLARSRARWVIVNLEDLWLETTAQNVPTTTNERPNWMPRLKLTTREIESDARVADLLGVVRKGRE